MAAERAIPRESDINVSQQSGSTSDHPRCPAPRIDISPGAWATTIVDFQTLADRRQLLLPSVWRQLFLPVLNVAGAAIRFSIYGIKTQIVFCSPNHAYPRSA